MLLLLIVYFCFLEETRLVPVPRIVLITMALVKYLPELLSIVSFYGIVESSSEL